MKTKKRSNVVVIDPTKVLVNKKYVVGSVSNTIFNVDEAKLNYILGKLVELEALIGGSANDSEARTDISSIATDLTSVLSRLSSLESQITNKADKVDVNSIASEVDNILILLGGIQQELSDKANSSDVLSNSDRISTLENAVSQLQSALANIGTTGLLSGLATDDELSGAINNLRNELIGAIESKIAELKRYIDNNFYSKTQMDSKLVDLDNGTTAKITTNINQLKTEITNNYVSTTLIKNIRNEWNSDIANAVASYDSTIKTYVSDKLAYTVKKEELQAKLDTAKSQAVAQAKSETLTEVSDTYAKSTKIDELKSSFQTTVSQSVASVQSDLTTLTTAHGSLARAFDGLKAEYSTKKDNWDNAVNTAASIKHWKEASATEEGSYAYDLENIRSEFENADTQVKTEIEEELRTVTDEQEAIALDVENLKVEKDKVKAKIEAVKYITAYEPHRCSGTTTIGCYETDNDGIVYVCTSFDSDGNPVFTNTGLSESDYLLSNIRSANNQVKIEKGELAKVFWQNDQPSIPAGQEHRYLGSIWIKQESTTNSDKKQITYEKKKIYVKTQNGYEWVDFDDTQWIANIRQLATDGNGYIVGWEAVGGSGQKSDFKIHADTFKIVPSSGNTEVAPFEYDSQSGLLKLSSGVKRSGRAPFNIKIDLVKWSYARIPNSDSWEGTNGNFDDWIKGKFNIDEFILGDTVVYNEYPSTSSSATALKTTNRVYKGKDTNGNNIWIESVALYVDGNMVVNGAITSEKINSGAITADKIQANTIVANHIVDGNVETSKIANGAVSDICSASLLHGMIANFYGSNHYAIDASSFDINGFTGTQVNKSDSSTGEYIVKVYFQYQSNYKEKLLAAMTCDIDMYVELENHSSTNPYTMASISFGFMRNGSSDIEYLFTKNWSQSTTYEIRINRTIAYQKAITLPAGTNYIVIVAKAIGKIDNDLANINTFNTTVWDFNTSLMRLKK